MGKSKMFVVREHDLPAIVVLDTNIVWQDRHLKSALANLCQEKPKVVSLAIPQVVLREYEGRIRKEATESVDSLLRTLENHRKVTGEFHPFPLKEPAVYGSDAAKHLRTRITETKILVLPLPPVTHDQILARDTATRKPFQDSGKGYRDALIWESVLVLVKAGHHVALVSNDNDFGIKDELDAELQSEVTSFKGAGTVVRYRDVSKCINEFVKPRLDKGGKGPINIKELSTKANQAQVTPMVASRLLQMGSTLLNDNWGGSLPDEWVGADVVSATHPHEVKFKSVTRLLNGGLLAEAEFETRVLAQTQHAIAENPGPDEWTDYYAEIRLKGVCYCSITEEGAITGVDIGLLELTGFDDDEDSQYEWRDMLRDDEDGRSED